MHKRNNFQKFMRQGSKCCGGIFLALLVFILLISMCIFLGGQEYSVDIPPVITLTSVTEDPCYEKLDFLLRKEVYTKKLYDVALTCKDPEIAIKIQWGLSRPDYLILRNLLKR